MSKGEMNNFSLDVAREQAGDLKLICLDGFHDLDTEMQNKLMITMKTDDFQYFLTVTDTGEFRIEHKLGDGE
jgi:recombinational DNA repair ATPase RecF